MHQYDWIFTSGDIINAGMYCETLKKLRRAIQNKRRGQFNKQSACFTTMPDLTRPMSRSNCWTPWDILNQPPYFSDQVPSDYHLFTSLKKHMCGKNVQQMRKWRGGQQMDKGGRGRVLQGKHQKMYVPPHNLHWKGWWLCGKIVHKYTNVTT